MDENHVNSVQLLRRQHLLRKYTSGSPDCTFSLSIPVQMSPCSDLICSLLFTYIHQKTLRLVLSYIEISAKTATEVHEALQLLLKLSL